MDGVWKVCGTWTVCGVKAGEKAWAKKACGPRVRQQPKGEAEEKARKVLVHKVEVVRRLNQRADIL